MAIAILLLGAIFLSTGIRGTQSELAAQLQADFSGAGSFWNWIAAIIIVGGVGYFSPLRQTSRLTLGLIILVFMLSNRGIWSNLQAGIAAPEPASTEAAKELPKATKIADVDVGSPTKTGQSSNGGSSGGGTPGAAVGSSSGSGDSGASNPINSGAGNGDDWSGLGSALGSTLSGFGSLTGGDVGNALSAIGSIVSGGNVGQAIGGLAGSTASKAIGGNVGASIGTSISNAVSSMFGGGK